MTHGLKRERERLRRIRDIAHALADVAVAYEKLDPAQTHHIANASILKAMNELVTELRQELAIFQAGE